MISVFLDASVLFAAVYSRTGFAHDLLRLILRGKVKAIVSDDVLEEVERNLSRKAPETLAIFKRFMSLAAPEIITNLTKEEVWAVEAYVAQKDAPIVAAAIRAQADYLVTYDRKHLLEPPEVAEKSGLQIVTPDVVVVQALQG